MNCGYQSLIDGWMDWMDERNNLKSKRSSLSVDWSNYNGYLFWQIILMYFTFFFKINYVLKHFEMLEFYRMGWFVCFSLPTNTINHHHHNHHHHYHHQLSLRFSICFEPSFSLSNPVVLNLIFIFFPTKINKSFKSN